MRYGSPNRIIGEKGHIVFGNPPQIYLREAWGTIPAETWHELPAGGDGGGRAGMIDKFVQAIWEDRDPPVTGWDGRAALEIAVAAYRAGRSHQPVDLPLDA